MPRRPDSARIMRSIPRSEAYALVDARGVIVAKGSAAKMRSLAKEQGGTVYLTGKTKGTIVPGVRQSDALIRGKIGKGRPADSGW